MAAEMIAITIVLFVIIEECWLMLWMNSSRAFFLTCRMIKVVHRERLCVLPWREGCDNLLERWIATERIPVRQQFQVTVSQRAWRTDRDRKLFAGEIFFTDPRGDHREVFDHTFSVNRIFFYGKKLNCAAALPQCFFFPPQPGVN